MCEYLFLWTRNVGGLTLFIILLLCFYLFITNSRSTRIGAGAIFVCIVIPRGIIKFRLLGGLGMRSCYVTNK